MMGLWVTDVWEQTSRDGLPHIMHASSIYLFLGPPHTLSLRVICEELSTVKYKSFDIGIQLGVPHHKLKEFKKEVDPLSEAVNYWLNGNAEEVPVSWMSVVAALESSHVEETGLAKKIKKKYCQQQNALQDNGTVRICACNLIAPSP